MGYRCFQTLVSSDELPSDSVMCPATTAAKASCNTCGLCSGTKVKAKDIGVVIHGLSWKVDRATKAINKAVATMAAV